LGKFDSKFLIQAINQVTGIDHTKVDIKGPNAENMSEIRIHCYIFKDSLAFLSSSLGSLAKKHLENYETFELLKEHPMCLDSLGRFSQVRYDLLASGKSPFPYDYVTSQEALLETVLPPKEAFFNKLKNEPISDENYEHAKKIWSVFECKSLGDYMSCYLKLDVMLLADVMSSFSKKSGEVLGLYPEHYRSLPGLAFDAAKIKTEMNLELPKTLDQVEFYEEGMYHKNYKKCNTVYVICIFLCIYLFFGFKGIRGGFTNVFQKYFATAQDYGDLSPEQKALFPHQEYNDMVVNCGGRPNLLYVRIFCFSLV
jgi:hypothetical protein